MQATRMNFVKREKPVWLALLILTVLFYLPIILNSEILLERGNDLEHQFWPVFYFIKQQFLAHHSLPLWNNLFFSGTPLLPDPQFPLFYPPYIAFLLLPTDAAFLLLIILHTLFGGIGAYLVARRILGLGKFASSFTGVLFVFMPRISGYLEAGHFGLVEATAFLPWVFLATFMLTKKTTPLGSILLAISLAGVFYTHSIIFLLTLLILVLGFGPVLTIERLGHFWSKRAKFFLLSALLTFGLVAITFLPQIEWAPQTTRFLLLQDRDVYPKWISFKEFLQTILMPWTYEGGIGKIDAEKWLTFGATPLLLALFGFFFLKRKIQAGIVLGTLTVVLISLNNLSPFYPLFLSLDWYVLARIATRIWFVPTLLVIFLAGLGLDRLTKHKKAKGFVVPLATLIIVESLLLSWVRILKPIPAHEKLAPKEVYEFLKRDDSGRFRVFCVNRCLSQKEAVKAGLELVEGYNTLQQMNYYKHSWQLMGGYWDYYTLSLPPIGTYHFEELQPDAFSLGLFNTKYVISPHKLTGDNFVLQEQYDEYFVYKNITFQERAYFWTEDQKPGDEAKILSYSPNKIRVDTSLNQTTRLVLAEVWSPGWKAYLNGDKDAIVQEKPDTLRLVDIKPDTKFVDFVYEPDSFKAGRTITFITLVLLLGYGIYRWKKYSAS